LIKWVGFRQHSIEYTPSARHSGKTKYTFRKMVNLALQGMTSFTTRPFLFSAYLGFSLAMLSLLVYIPYMINSVVNHNHFPTWATLISAVVFFGGLNLTVLGFVGIYIAKLFMQAKERPSYIVKHTNLAKEPNLVLHDLVEL
jgi:polyisoprenyl-phosphate glycosyltransferase